MGDWFSSTASSARPASLVRKIVSHGMSMVMSLSSMMMPILKLSRPRAALIFSVVRGGERCDRTQSVDRRSAVVAAVEVGFGEQVADAVDRLVVKRVDLRSPGAEDLT